MDHKRRLGDASAPPRAKTARPSPRCGANPRPTPFALGCSLRARVRVRVRVRLGMIGF